MKLTKRMTPEGPRLYVQRATGWVDLTAELGVRTFRDLFRAVCETQGGLGSLAAPKPMAEALEPAVGFDQTNACTLADDEAKILCVGFNFLDHATESRQAKPQWPTLFVRYTQSLVGPGEALVRPAPSVQFDWEGEVAVVVGRTARRVARDAAWHHIAALTLFGDHSARDFQAHSTQATAGKNFDGSGSMGPWLTTVDDVPDFGAITLTTHLNGERVQHAALSELVSDVPALIEYVSTFMTLQPGDVIALGTPKGVGHRMTPPRYLTSGDRLEISATGLGTLINTVSGEEQ